MSIDARQLRTLVIRPTLKRMGLYSRAAENLLMGTAAQESHLGKYLHQLGNGPAQGIFQMEPATHDDIWEHFLAYPRRELLADELRRMAGVGPDQVPDSSVMIGNLYYAAAMARVHYLRRPDPLPEADDAFGLANYWKDHYNTHLGRGTVGEFLRNYERLVTVQGG